MKLSKLNLAIPLLLLIGFTGCASITPGADPLVVNAERSEQAATDTVEAFVKFDEANRDLLIAKAPAVHSVAESVRVDFPPLVEAARKATEQYKASNVPADGTAAQKAVAAVMAIAGQAAQGLIDGQSAVGN